MHEVWAGDNLVAFDGRVLEIFGHPASPSARFHVSNLDVEFLEPDRNGRRQLIIRAAGRHSGGYGLTVQPEDLAEVEPFFDRVLAAMPDRS